MGEGSEVCSGKVSRPGVNGCSAMLFMIFCNSISSWTRDHKKLVVSQLLKKYLPVVILYRDRNLKKLVLA
jgi:hypothetical protein